jgi:putative SOS response-associated peptidase YedK
MPMLPLTTSEDQGAVKPAMWKLLPFWVKTMADAKKYANTLNATCEDIFEKASYKPYIQKYRALLWVNGFFEPHHPAPGITIPYYVSSINGDPFTLGCVYSNWTDQGTGEVITTFSVITAPANELMSQVHNDKKRMPVIIAPDLRDKWLGVLDRPGIVELMRPLPEGILQAHPVSNQLYKKGVNTNVPEIILAV